MNILFHVTLTTMLRHFEGVVRSLADRGHTVRIASTEREELPPPASLVGVPRVSFVTSPGRRGDAWAEPIHELRLLRDALRYLDSRFKRAPKLRARAMRKMLDEITDGERTHLVAKCPQCRTRHVDDQVIGMMHGSDAAQAKLGRLFALMEETIPSDRAIEDFLRAERPDVVLVTPLVKLGSYQADYVKSAQALGIPVGLPVFSWDNLSTKGLIHVVPDRVFVWNERQRIEATKMHRVPAERVVVTGAPRFDEFFAMTPQVTREGFCEAHGFDPAHPIVTYLCSSEFVAGKELDFVIRWIDEVRQAPALRSCNILIRPHPRQQGQWKTFTTDRPGVAVSMPRSISVDPSLFDTLHHSAAAVGLNTSAELEAGIAGCPVLTILAPEFSEGQQGTLHFHYLLKDHGGFVELATDFETHRQQLEAAVAKRFDAAAIRAFIQTFVRPHGLDRPVTPLAVEAIEDLARIGAARRGAAGA